MSFFVSFRTAERTVLIINRNAAPAGVQGGDPCANRHKIEIDRKDETQTGAPKTAEERLRLWTYGTRGERTTAEFSSAARSRNRRENVLSELVAEHDGEGLVAADNRSEN